MRSAPHTNYAKFLKAFLGTADKWYQILTDVGLAPHELRAEKPRGAAAKIWRELKRLFAPHHWGRAVSRVAALGYLIICSLAIWCFADRGLIFGNLRHVARSLDGKKVLLVVLYGDNELQGDLLRAVKNVGPDWQKVYVRNTSWAQLAFGGDTQPDLGEGEIYLRRPNIGYDFGAYRDFARLLTRCGLGPAKVLLSNDSIAPLVPSAFQRALHTLESQDQGFVGYVDNSHVPFDVNRHYGSFLLCFDFKNMNLALFHDFWRRFPYYATKADVIHFGEKGIWREFASRGVSHACAHGSQKFDLDHMDLAELRQLASYIYIPRDFARFWQVHTAVQQAIGRGEIADLALIRDWISDLRDVLVSTQGFALALARYQGFGFIKRDIHRADPWLLDSAREGFQHFLDTNE